MDSMGGWEWAQAGGGVLSPRERWGLRLGAMAARLKQWRRGRLMPPAPGLLELDADALRHIAPPHDKLARAALAAAEAVQPRWLTEHAWRTYAWGSLLALNQGLKPDRSLFFAAALLHDLGLTEAHAEPARRCFAVRGAAAAEALMRQAGASPVQAACVAEAISLHLNPRVPVECGVEAHLVQAGAALDVIGRRHREVPGPLRQAVLQRHPRLQMKAALCPCLPHQADAAPHTRIGLWVHRFGFIDLVRQAPFDE